MSYAQQPSCFDDSLMSGYGDGTGSLYDTFSMDTVIDDDILGSVSTAAFLATEDLGDDFANFQPEPETPAINVIPPSRVNTQVVPEEVVHEDGAEEMFQPTGPGNSSWARMVIGAGETTTSSVAIPAASLTASHAPSESVFSDSGFASVEACERCGEVYKNNSLRKKHILKHMKPFVCHAPGCKRTEGFATTNDVDRHRRSVHKEGLQKWWKCAYRGCSKTSKEHYFDRRDNFVAHIKRRHDELMGSDIDALVQNSEHIPTPEELAHAIYLKEHRPPARSSVSRTSSVLGSGSRAARKRKARSERSDTASMCGPSTPIDAESRSVLLVGSAPESMQYLASSPVLMREMAYMGGGAEMLVEQGTPTPGRHNTVQTDLPHQYPRQVPRSVPGSGFVFTAGNAGQTSLVSQGKQPVSASQPVFRKIARDQFVAQRDQFAAQRSFNSILSDQMSFQSSFAPMQSGLEEVPEAQVVQQGYYKPSYHPGLQMDNYHNDGETSPSGCYDMSFDQSFDSSPSGPVYDSFGVHQSSMSFFDVNLDARLQGMDIDPLYSSRSLLDHHEYVDQG